VPRHGRDLDHLAGVGRADRAESHERLILRQSLRLGDEGADALGGHGKRGTDLLRCVGRHGRGWVGRRARGHHHVAVRLVVGLVALGDSVLIVHCHQNTGHARRVEDDDEATRRGHVHRLARGQPRHVEVVRLAIRLEHGHAERPGGLTAAVAHLHGEVGLGGAVRAKLYLGDAFQQRQEQVRQGGSGCCARLGRRRRDAGRGRRRSRHDGGLDRTAVAQLSRVGGGSPADGSQPRDLPPTAIAAVSVADDQRLVPRREVAHDVVLGARAGAHPQAADIDARPANRVEEGGRRLRDRLRSVHTARARRQRRQHGDCALGGDAHYLAAVRLHGQHHRAGAVWRVVHHHLDHHRVERLGGGLAVDADVVDQQLDERHPGGAGRPRPYRHRLADGERLPFSRL